MPCSEQLACLQNLLENLPELISYHTFNHQSIFGSRHSMGGIVTIEERGPGICAVVSFLTKCSLVDARINHLCYSAEKLHTPDPMGLAAPALLPPP